MSDNEITPTPSFFRYIKNLSKPNLRTIRKYTLLGLFSILSGPLWDRCDLKLSNFELFNFDNAVELRVSINKAVYPSFYKNFESKIKKL